MPQIFMVDGVAIDVRDRQSVQALTSEQYADLLRLALQTPPDPDDEIVNLREEQRSGPILWTRPTLREVGTI